MKLVCPYMKNKTNILLVVMNLAGNMLRTPPQNTIWLKKYNQDCGRQIAALHPAKAGRY